MNKDDADRHFAVTCHALVKAAEEQRAEREWPALVTQTLGALAGAVKALQARVAELEGRG